MAKAGRPPYFASEEATKGFIEKVIIPFEKLIYQDRLIEHENEHFTPPETLLDYEGDATQKQFLIEYINDFMDGFFNFVRGQAPENFPQFVSTYDYWSELESKNEAYLKKGDFLKGQIGDFIFERDFKKDGTLEDWMDMQYLRRLISFRKNPEEKHSLAEKVNILCLFIGYEKWDHRLNKLDGEFHNPNHPIKKKIHIDDHTFFKPEKVNYELLHDTTIYRELNTRSNELFRYVCSVPEFPEYLLGIKTGLQDKVDDDPELQIFLFRFTEIAEFWEEVIVNRFSFRPSTYDRWRKYRRGLYEKSEFVRLFFKENGKEHSIQLLKDLETEFDQ